MKRIVSLLMLPVFIVCISCNRLTPEDARNAVVSGEMDRIPLIKQHLVFIDDITIDSMRITVDQEPMAGYLYTTWINNGQEEPIIVSVSDIRKSKTNKGYIEWMSDWEAAATAYFMKVLL